MFRGISTGDVDHNGQVNPPPRITPTGCRGIVIAAFVVLVVIVAVVSCVMSGGGEVVGYTTQYINGRYVGIRGDSQGLYFVQVGFSAEGAKTSGWVTHEEANKFIYENTKG